MSEPSPEDKILAIARFIDQEHTSELIRKADVVTILRWASRAARPGALEVPRAWVDATLSKYKVSDDEVKKWLQKSPELKLIQ